MSPTSRTKPTTEADETRTRPEDVAASGAKLGEHAYAGERSEDVQDDRPDERKPGTAAHLGGDPNPYAGSAS